MAKRWHGIPTTYRGIKFRSRLEATWTAYLDIRGDVKWEYEPVDFPGWIPDFSLLVENAPQPVLVEVKPIQQLEVFLNSTDSLKMQNALNQAQTLSAAFSGVFLFGISPQYIWYVQPESAWAPALHMASEDLMDCWNQARNTTQWRAPR